MIRNYVTIAWRNIKNHPGYSAINIIGLSIGITACVLILQYVLFELSFENFHTKKDRIYRVEQDRYDNGKLSTQWAAGAYPVGNYFKEAIPEIEDYVKLLKRDKQVANIDNQPIKIDECFFAGASFFKIFSYPLLKGNPETALRDPYSAVVSETTARNLFGKEDPLGKMLDINQEQNYKITGVFKDMPENTQLQPNLLLSYSTFINRALQDSFDSENAWLADGCLTYILLKEKADPAAVEAKFPPIVEKATGAALKKFNAAVTYRLQPLKDIHLYSHYMMEPGITGDGKTVYLLLGIAFFIIIIAWVNYINLATARAIGRAREVGIRKAIGSQRRQLIVQFLSESAVLNGIALLLALLLVLVAIPGFNALTGQNLGFSLLSRASFWLAMTGLFVAGVFFSGLYPAFVLSGFKPVLVLKGKLVSTGKGALLRKSLVVFQFAASLFLLAGTMVVYNQIQFMRKEKLGINIEQTLVISPPVVNNDSTFLKRMEAYKQKLQTYASVGNISVSTTIPGQPVGWNAGGIKLVGTDESTQKQYRVIGVDYDFLKTYDLKLIAGRAFSREFGTDDHAVIYNRRAVEHIGFNKPEEAIGKRIDFWGQQYEIIGVTENFHNQSLKDAFEPLIIRLTPAYSGYISIKTNAKQVETIVDAAKKEWADFFPGNTFEYFFLDEHFAKQYVADQRFGKVFGIFTLFAILVACMGLFGLASYTTLQRKKEIGIRKVLGASVPGILSLLYKEFAILLGISFLIGAPLAWISSYKWLEGYAFRTDLEWYVVVVPFLVIAAIALITVSFQSVRAAVANPVHSLRSE
jgi:putative ABC transport system permease protein